MTDMEKQVIAPVTRSSAFAPIRSRRRQFDLHEPAHQDVFDIEAEYRLVRVTPVDKPRARLQRAIDVAAAAAAAFLIIGSSMFMLELSNQRTGPVIALQSLTGPLQAAS